MRLLRLIGWRRMDLDERSDELDERERELRDQQRRLARLQRLARERDLYRRHPRGT